MIWKLGITWQNDVHGKWENAAQRVTFFQHQRKYCDHLVNLNLGDLWTAKAVAAQKHTDPEIDASECRLLVQEMNLEKVDYFVPGNHDLDRARFEHETENTSPYRTEFFQLLGSRNKFKTLAANVTDCKGNYIPDIPSWDVKVFKPAKGWEIRIAFIGITHPINDVSYSMKEIAGPDKKMTNHHGKKKSPLAIRYIEPYENLTFTMQKLLQNWGHIDIAFILAHVDGKNLEKFQKYVKIIKKTEDGNRFPHIPAIIAGHLHDFSPSRESLVDTPIFLAGSKGQHIGVADFEFDLRTKKVSAYDFTVKIGPNIPPNPQMAQLIAEHRALGGMPNHGSNHHQ